MRDWSPLSDTSRSLTATPLSSSWRDEWIDSRDYDGCIDGIRWSHSPSHTTPNVPIASPGSWWLSVVNALYIDGLIGKRDSTHVTTTYTTNGTWTKQHSYSLVNPRVCINDYEAIIIFCYREAMEIVWMWHQQDASLIQSRQDHHHHSLPYQQET